MSHDLRDVLHTLLLPLSPAAFELAVPLVIAELDRMGINENSHAEYISLAMKQWRSSGRPTGRLKKVVELALGEEPRIGSDLPSNYFKVHSDLIKKGMLSFADASAILSHANMVARLLDEDRMSCGQVANVIGARRSGFTYNWNQIAILARGMGKLPQVDEKSMAETLARDVADSQTKLTDSSPADAIDVLDGVARSLGYPDDLGDALRRFSPTEDGIVPAYSIILHYNLLITEFFDHPITTAAYEFNPRSNFVHETLQYKYHPSYTGRQNAYLNNSKSAVSFDMGWAWGRTSNQRMQALALSSILEAFSMMAYPARQELARWVRPWLMRVEEIWGESEVQLNQVTESEILPFLHRVAERNTGTQGIIEQRVVDLLGSLAVGPTVDCEIRGRSDSVSASNVSRRKTGDVEFRIRDGLTIRAFEAHGGALTPFYVNLHALTLGDVLNSRRVELNQLGEASDWRITVEFIAHDISAMSGGSGADVVAGYGINWKYRTFGDLITEIAGRYSNIELLEYFDDLVTKHIDSRWVSPEVKMKFNQLLEDDGSSIKSDIAFRQGAGVESSGLMEKKSN